MRLWPFPLSTAHGTNGVPAEGYTVVEDLLRRNIEDIFRVERQEVRGATFGWGGQLLVEPARALALIEPRLKRFGYTPFLGRQGDLVWIRAVPLADVKETSRPGLNLLLFVLTVLSTLAAGCLISGSFPFGTMGAVIRMRSPARDRNSLFDIAVAGPIAGLVVAVPALLLGLQWSRLAKVVPEMGTMTFGDSLLMRLLTWMVFGPIPEGMDVFVHPVALAGWVGLFVTALNLFPVGQLDGGRIAYALVGGRHRQVSIATLVGLAALGAVFQSANWIVFGALILLLMGFHHAPPLDDLTPLSPRRYVLGIFCLILLVLLIPPVPIS